MNNDNFHLIIGRQFGSGGKELGKKIAERLGIPCYDKSLLVAAAERLGLRADLLRNKEEKRPSRLRSFLSCNPGINSDNIGNNFDSSSIYSVQTNVIRQLSIENSCVFVGRTADYILRDHKRMLSIFLHAAPQWRARRIVERGDAANIREAHDLLIKKDKERQSYYNYYTGRKWGEASTYHLTADTSIIPIDILTEFIIDILNRNHNIIVNKLNVKY